MMSNFIVNNILIEKTDRDIPTGKSYNFSDGFNLICGNNEAGKSSIMNFLKESFFRAKGSEIGKISFEINENKNSKKYRADIKSTSAKNNRCFIFDEDNKSIDYSFVEDNIKQNYFKMGFTINLDDLNSLNDGKIDLVNAIKDPLNDKLSSCLSVINFETSEILTDGGKLKTLHSDILKKIKSLDNEINELSQKEGEYNSAVEQISTLNLEIAELKNIINFLKLSININSLKSIINDKKNELNLQENNFNQKLFENRNKAMDLFNHFAKYENNRNLQEKNQEKIEKQIQNIKTKIADLIFEYGLSFDEDVIKNIAVDNSKNFRIKELVEQNKVIIASIKAKEENEKLYQSELSTLSNVPDKSMTTEELEQLKTDLENDRKSYDYLRDEIDEIDKKIIESKANNTNKQLFIGMGVITCLSIVASLIAMINKINFGYIFAIFAIVIIFTNLICLKISKNNFNFVEEKTRKEEHKNKIFNNLKQEISKYYSDFDFNFINQIETIIYSLDSLIKKKNLLLQLKQELSELKYKLEVNKQEILSLKDEQFKAISDDKYLDVITNVALIKEDFKISDEFKKENEIFEEENAQIWDIFKNFIVENGLIISLTSDFNENKKALNEEIERNNQIKIQIDTLKKQIEQDEIELQKITEKNADLLQKSDVVIEDDIEDQIKQIEENLQEKEKLRNEFCAKKINLEKFEGIADKKIERNLLLDEYRQIVKKLMLNQMALSLVNVAKSNFNQTQPDLVNAQKYLSILTGGKYSKINLELQEISNDDNSLIKKWDILSRGTREQLYLALRLGYASNYSSKNNKPSLPLIIDDAFVNFDVLRTKNALNCLNEFAKTNQVLFFTCHYEQMQALLKDLKINDVKIINV